MKAIRLHLPSLAWFAIVAMLALALLPTVSRAMAQAQGGRTAGAELCTAQGMVRVILDGAPGDPAAGPVSPETASGHLDHCPFCSLSAQAAGLASAPPWPLTLVAAAGHLPPPCLQAPHTRLAWCSAQPRAPPSHA